MKHYNIIKIIVILFLLYEVIGLIGQLGVLISYLTYFEGSLTDVYGFGIGLLFVFAVFAIVYYCILKVDTILSFFKIDTLFTNEDQIESSKINANWISLLFISLGLYIIIPQVVIILTDGLSLLQSNIQSNGIDRQILDSTLNKNQLIQSLLQVLIGIVLITQSKYLGKWVGKKVLEDVEVET